MNKNIVERLRYFLKIVGSIQFDMFRYIFTLIKFSSALCRERKVALLFKRLASLHLSYDSRF